MTTKIKICGLSRPEEVDAAAQAGATHIGLMHYAPSKRHISLEQAAALARHAPLSLQTVLVMVNASAELTGKAIEIVRPHIIQFHGSETPEWLRLVKEKTGIGVWKALGVKTLEVMRQSDRYIGAADVLLFDAPAGDQHGGTGTSFDWGLLAQYDHKIPWGLAGGLDIANVADAIRQTGAPLVDVSSGVETVPGVKDMDKIAAFCQAVQQYDTARTDS
ncbi:phosphoribosylanthranilate isomerase [Sphingorhabdus arenilitoris]|uniref:N-(5'-phosphoribosyl)anthranilate isomerase n=1 Tax=Sphingorhabdus arenilitoris TaxID=1490041 RepID=A0ABV8RG01_9SPHN